MCLIRSKRKSRGSIFFSLLSVTSVSAKLEHPKQLQGLTVLLMVLPASAGKLLSKDMLRTDEEKVHALKGLAKLHRGEAAKVNPTRSTSHLEFIPPGSANRGGALGFGDGRWGKQRYCLPRSKSLLSIGEQERDDAFREY